MLFVCSELETMRTGILPSKVSVLCSHVSRLNCKIGIRTHATAIARQTHYQNATTVALSKVQIEFDIFYKLAIPCLSFSLRSCFQQLTVNIFKIKFSLRLDSNCGPLVSEATFLPNEPQSCRPGFDIFCRTSTILFRFRNPFRQRPLQSSTSQF